MKQQSERLLLICMRPLELILDLHVSSTNSDIHTLPNCSHLLNYAPHKLSSLEDEIQILLVNYLLLNYSLPISTDKHNQLDIILEEVKETQKSHEASLRTLFARNCWRVVATSLRCVQVLPKVVLDLAEDGLELKSLKVIHLLHLIIESFYL